MQSLLIDMIIHVNASVVYYSNTGTWLLWALVSKPYSLYSLC